MPSVRRVLLAFDLPYAVPRGHDFAEEWDTPDEFYTEIDVHAALRANRWDVRRLGVYDDFQGLIDEVREYRPDVVFNLVDTFRGVTRFDKNMAALLELLDAPYTGATSAALHLCNDKALSKKVLRYHRVRTPRFQTFYRARGVWLPRTLKLPCIVKPLTEEASRGISLASIVDDESAFIDRVRMIHETMKLDAIAEEYIEGRELYLSLFGDQRLQVLPPREMTFGKMPEDEPRIATYKAKWDLGYRKRWGITDDFAKALSPRLRERLTDTCKRAYRALNIRSYARFDLRLTPAGQVYVIEPNVNPCIARNDEFAKSADRAGIPYPALIRRLVHQALRRRT